MSISPIPELSQEQREAIFDLMLLAMYADSMVKLAENERVYELIAGLGWKSYQDPTEYSQLATARARAASESAEKTLEFLQNISGRLAGQDARNFALVMLMRLNESDKSESAEESQLYTQAKAVFGV